MRFRVPLSGCGVISALILCSSSAHAATIHVSAGGDLQSAINAAQAGDVITLDPGGVYVGNFVLPNKGALGDYITIRSSADDSSLPPSNVRITPAYTPYLPVIRSSNNMSAVHTAAGANHYRLMFLEFQANVKGYGDLIALGAGDSTQTSLTQVPYALVLDRVYVHGDPVMGQKRGIALHSRDTSIINSYISDCKAVGQEAQAISGFNGPGNYLIENNYLEGSTQSFLLGGADPTIPNLVTTNVTVRLNHMTKQLAWRDPIIATPAAVSATSVSGGSLAAGTYSYKVEARVSAGQTTKANSSPSVEVSATIPAGATGSVTVSWTPVVGAADYVVYGRAAGAENTYWVTTNPYFTDTGAAGASGSPPSATKWYVKNVFELKNAQDVVVEGNVFENLWVAAQPGYPIVFTPRNQSGTAPWAVVQRVTFQHNLVRHTAGGVNILGTDNVNPSQLTNHITVRDNIFDDLTASTWGSGARPFQVGDGPDAVTIDHNTVVTTDSSIVWMYGGSATLPTPITNAAYTNNMSAHNTYGMDGSNYSPGLSSIAAYMPGSIVAGNVLAGGSASKYPTGNYFPTVTAWQGSFANYANGDYHLAATSPYKNAGTDGADLGANVDTLNAYVANALSGDNRILPGATAVRITTTSLPDGMLNQPYAQTIGCAGASAGCAWQVVDATLPAGVAFDTTAGVVAGTPTSVQTGALNVVAYDPAWPSNSAAATLTVTVDPPPFVVTMPPAPQAQVGVPYQLAAAVSGAMGAVTWSVVSGALPPGISVDSNSGAIAGTPIMWGSSTALIQAADSWRVDRTAAQPVTISVAPTSLAIATSTLGTATYQLPYQGSLTSSGGTGSTVWTVVGGALPAGVTLSASGVVSGVPTELGTFNVVIQAIDTNWQSNTATAALTLVVNPPVLTATAPAAVTGQIGVPMRFQASASGNVGAVSWTTDGGLPPGVVLNVDGTVAGTPAAYGTFTATLQAHDAYDASRVASATTTIVVAPSAMSVATATLPDGQLRTSYSATLAVSGGTGSATWALSAGSLPAGLTLSADGTISGTPSTLGSASFTVTASDANWAGYVASRSLTLTVGEQLLLEDTFAALDRTKWPGGTFTSDPDLTVPVSVSSGAFVVGPLKASTAGSHYDGMNSAAFGFGDGSVSVQVVQPASGDAYTMFAAGYDINNFYRWYVSAGSLVVERKIAGTKKTLATTAYTPALHQYLRIRNESNPATGGADVVFEIAPDDNGAPGAFSVFYREGWDARVVTSAIRFELKAGTSTAVAAPGSAKFDNFRATRK